MSESGSPALSDDASVAAAVGEWAGIWRLLMLPLILLTIAIAGIGIYVYVSARTVVTQKIAADMESIAKLKTGQIEQWLAERRQDLELISTSQLSIDLEHWLAGGASDERLKSRLLAQLRFPGTTDYGTVSLLSPVDGRVLLTSGDPELLPASRTQAMESAWRGFLVFDNIHAAAGGQSEATDIEIFNPVRAVDSQRVLAVIHATLQPDQLLFPLLETWPGASKTAETLLLRREGDDLLFLNGRRRDDGSVWQLRRPLGATTNIFASRLLAEGERFLQADDYRGERVLAYGRPVAGTPWFLVAKVDQAEAYAQFDMAVRIAVALFGALLLVCAWWLFARKQAEMALQGASQETEKSYATRVPRPAPNGTV